MKNQFSGVKENHEIHLIYCGEDQACYLYVGLPKFDIVRVDERFSNLKMASAVLRSELGYQYACDVLDAAGVPRSSMLWHLNHDGPPKS